jgi:hypothetical protein
VTLHKVADGSRPHPPYDFLPAEFVAWIGYVGGHTPYVWTDQDIAGVLDTGRAWWATWTAPVGQVIGAAVGTADAAGTVAALIARNYPTSLPVFYDVEHSTWAASPAGVLAAVDAWKHGIAGAGYRHGRAYLPWAAQMDWVALWTGVAPTSLPPNVVGIQYDHALHNDAYDASVFDLSLLGAEVPGMTQPQIDAINLKLDQVLERLGDFDATHPNATRLGTVLNRLTAMRDGDTGHADLPEILKAIADLPASLPPAGPTAAGTFTLTGSGDITVP